MLAAVSQYPVPILWFTTVGQTVADIRASQLDPVIPRLTSIRSRVGNVYADDPTGVARFVVDIKTLATDVKSYQTEVLSAGLVDAKTLVTNVSTHLSTITDAKIDGVSGQVTGVSSYQTEVLSAGIVDTKSLVTGVRSHLTGTTDKKIDGVSGQVMGVDTLITSTVVPDIAAVLAKVRSVRQYLENTVVPNIAVVLGGVDSILEYLKVTVVPDIATVLGVVESTQVVIDENVLPGIATVSQDVTTTHTLLVKEVVPARAEILAEVIPTHQVLVGNVVPGIAQVSAGVQATHQLLVQEVAPTTVEILGVVIPTQQVLVQQVVPAIAQVIVAIQDAQQVVEGTVVSVSEEIMGVVQPTQQVVVGTVVPGIAQVWGGIVTLNSGLHELVGMLPPLMPGPTAPPMAALGLQLVQAFDDSWPRMPRTVGDAAESAIEGLKERIRGWFEDFEGVPKEYLDWVSDNAGTDLALDPVRAYDLVNRLYATAIGAGSVAHIASTALNAVPTLNWVGASQLAAFIAEVAGFKPITEASYGVMLNQCVANPLRYYWNEKLRPRIPTEGAIYAMGRKRGLDYDEFSAAMAMQGLPDEWIDKEYTFFWADPSPYWLLRMSEHATPEVEPVGLMREWYDKWVPNWETDPWAWYRAKLMMSGFEDSDIQPFIDGFQRRRVGPAVTRLKTAIRHMAREAYWDDAEVRDELSALGVREDEINYLIDAERIQRQNDYLDDQVRYYNESFRKGEISRQDLSLVLSTIIVKPEVVEQIVSREVVRALPKPKAVVPVREDPRVKSLVTQAVNSWTKGYRAWELEEEEFEVGLNIVLQDPALALQMVMVERTRYRPEPPPPKPPVEDPLIRKARVAAIASWVSQFREAKITAEVMELGLANLIVDPDIVVLIRQIEELRAVPAPDILPPWEEEPLVAAVRQEAVRGHIEMFRKRLIDIDELYAYLLADGLAEPLARATALTQALKRIKTPPLESPYFQKDRLRELIDEAIASYTRMLELGQITMDEFEAYLAGAGVDPDVITYLGDTQEVRRFILLEGMA